MMNPTHNSGMTRVLLKHMFKHLKFDLSINSGGAWTLAIT